MTLHLSGFPTPEPAFRVRGTVLHVRAPAPLAAWAVEQAEAEGVTVNRWLIRVLEERRAGGPVLPADVMHWLLAQAAACRRPGEWEHALVATVRDLAETYPMGCRL
jgi:hypothetical protein